MKQFIQNFKTGELKIEEVPSPAEQNGMVLVQNAYSVISAGTERATVVMGQASLLEKAKKRPDLVKQVIQNIQKEGLSATVKKVTTKLNATKAFGYSSAGMVLFSGDTNSVFKKGDRVACAGQDYASHAEVVNVPQNLVVKIPDAVSYEEAAFTTIGAIALQGVRQADLKIGEKVCVIGLGLIGQITQQIVKANGCMVCGIDVAEHALQLARKTGIDCAVNRADQNLMAILDDCSRGHGFDKIIITASTQTNDPIVLAAEITRKKGVIVVVGAVKMDVPREPYFYKKELELKIATSYGPGRYDHVYEEQGVDYPYHYVRFTENRNMEVFLELIAQGRVNVKALITHTFSIDEAKEAYALITDVSNTPPVGIVLQYDTQVKEYASRVTVNTQPAKDVVLGMIGAGSFAQSYLLPHLQRSNVLLDTVVTTKGISAKDVAHKYGFNHASTDGSDVIAKNDINAVVIATRHNSHARYVCDSLKAGKHVFVEKPLALTTDELKEVAKAYTGKEILMVGYNRRFAPVSVAIKEELEKMQTPPIMQIRVNAGFLPQGHWAQQKDVGGGRIIGEVCHFVDLLSYFAGSNPLSVTACGVVSDSVTWQEDDNCAITIRFQNGAVGTIVYTAMGDKKQPKELIEVFVAGNSYVINDFQEGIIFRGGKKHMIKNAGKGHKQEMQYFLDAVTGVVQLPFAFESLLYTTMTTLKIQDALCSGKVEDVNIAGLYA